MGTQRAGIFLVGVLDPDSHPARIIPIAEAEEGRRRIIRLGAVRTLKRGLPVPIIGTKDDT